MVGLRLWLRHSTAAKAAPALIGISIAVIASRHGWERDWRWAFDWAGFSIYLTGPALAGLVAFDRSRLVEPTVAALGKGTPRATLGMIALVFASWIWSVVAWVFALGYVAFRAETSGAVARPDAWSIAIPLAVLLGCAAFGLAMGTAVPNMAAGPVAVMVCFVVATTSILGKFGLPGILQLLPATGTMIGLEKNPVDGLRQIGIQLIFTVACVVWVGRSVAFTDWYRKVAGIALGVITYAVLLGLGVMTHGMESVRDAGQPLKCLEGHVVVCGPIEAGHLLKGAQKSMEAAVTRMAPSGLDLQKKYTFSPTDTAIPGSSGQLYLQPESMAGDALSVEDVASTLMTPRLCEASYADLPPKDLLASQGLVLEWVTAQLSRPDRVGPAPTSVAKAYQQLRSCVPVSPTTKMPGSE